MARMYETGCKKGHPPTDANTRLEKDVAFCRVCQREFQAAYRKARHNKDMHRPALLANPPSTHCIHGHALTPDNVYVRPDGFRKCRECQKRRTNAYDRSHREKRNESKRRRVAAKRTQGAEGMRL